MRVTTAKPSGASMTIVTLAEQITLVEAELWLLELPPPFFCELVWELCQKDSAHCCHSFYCILVLISLESRRS
jgi:hypothetical protein